MKQTETTRKSEARDQRFLPPAISLPKGGGALKGIEEKFRANPVTGTGSLTIALPLSPGRSGFTPELALSYDSGAGNGPYGFGWSVHYPAITRRTDRGLPRYLDNEESDVYILAGAEDLVPVLRRDGSRFEESRDGYRVTRYRPRIEGIFARIERWSSLSDPSDVFWRSISRDNITTFYGKKAPSRIADPSDPTRIFSWLLSESFDDKGNAALYEYVAEDGTNVDTSLASEDNRAGSARSANRYLKRVRYGNRTSRLLQPDLEQMDWLFELVMDYGDHPGENPKISPSAGWPVRPDPLSTYRPGFEVRTYRRCQRFLMFHHFQELGAEPKLVRSLDLDYEDLAYQPGLATSDELKHAGSTKIGSFLRRAALTGYADSGFRKSMPPLEFTYSRAQISEEAQTLDEADTANLAGGVDGIRRRWLDLDGEGISGVLTEQTGAWWYKPNLGHGHLGPQQLVARKPFTTLEARAQFLDLARKGRLDLVQFERPDAGFFERDDQEGWSEFMPFANQPNVQWEDPNLRLIDLTGDGLADILLTEDDIICWHQSFAEEGFGPRESLKMAPDESVGPRLVFHDTTDTVFLADMSGDGLTDLVRIRNSEVCYWPNLGYGRFGPRVTMDNAPLLDAPELFDPRRIRLADIDGSGTADMIYLGGDKVRLYFNRAGNSWADPYKLESFPPIDNLASVSVTDLLGNGTACLLWSTPLPNDILAPLRYVDLMGNQKPHLMVGVENNLGARTTIQYTSSTRFYLEDQLAGRPWITRLPFPVHVVERTETDDDISHNRFVSRFAYHHGYFDGVEREFRGFGMVEHWDTEEFAALNANQQLAAAANFDLSSHVPPVLTRTWFHTGIYIGRDRVSNFFAGLLDDGTAGEYYREPGLNNEQARRLLLDDTVIPAGLTVDEEREACRALKGAMLRQEVYALDGTSKEPHPYSVTEQNLTIRLLQPQGGNRHAVFLTHPRESVTYHYERIPADPRVAHSLTLEVDDFGNVLKSAAVAYGRRQADPALQPRDQQKQTELHVTTVESSVTNTVEGAAEYRAPLQFESRTYELTGLAPAAGQTRFSLAELLNAAASASAIPYEQNPSSGVLQKRLISQERTLYRRNDLTGALQLGQLESLALPFEVYRLALTPGLVAGVYGAKVTNGMLAAEGRYQHSEGDNQWWIPSGRVFFSPGSADDAAAELANAREHFFLPRRYQDPFGNLSTITYDAYDLLMTQSQDALGNLVTVGERDASGNIIAAGNDYRVLQPRLITDPNGNRTAVSFDAIGLVAATAVIGKAGEGDFLDGFVVDLAQEEIDGFYQADDPHTLAVGLLGRATTRIVYDLERFFKSRSAAPDDPTKREPAFAATISRETHVSDLGADQQSKMQISFSYSDGYGREIQKKIQAEPGPVVEGGVTVDPHWVSSGWTIFNNKGKPVRQYEPFFSQLPRGHQFEFGVKVGVSPILCYDPVERVVATLHPNHTYEKVVFDPWHQQTWDVNDNVLQTDPTVDPDVGNFFRRLQPDDYSPAWYSLRTDPAFAAQGAQRWPDQTTRTHEAKAAAKAAAHANTPATAYFDTLGRTFVTLADNGPEGKFATRVELDIQGNQRSVTDALDRKVMVYDYDMLGNRIHQSSMEAGERWMLNDVLGKAIRAWDSRGHNFRTEYDRLRRPTGLFVQGTDPVNSDPRTTGAAEVLFQKVEYGEGQPDRLNMRTRLFRVSDTAGVVTSKAPNPDTALEEGYDFKGNLLRGSRQFVSDYKGLPDWNTAPLLEPDVFSSSTRYDALNRPTSATTHDGSIVHPTYNEANFLETVSVNLRGAPTATKFVTNIDYDAKGQRALIEYGNNTKTNYSYDRETFRLVRLTTTRSGFPTDQQTVQDLAYTYDPAGNITRIQDDADIQNVVFFRNQRVEPSNDYVYDPIYRLIQATGREQLGFDSGGNQRPPTASSYNDVPRALLTPATGDPKAMGTYTENYRYDQVGNFLQLIHRGSQPAIAGWTRSYTYIEPSLLEPEKVSNRLTRTALNGSQPLNENYTHDIHGNMTSMPQLQAMQCNFKDELLMTRRQAVNSSDADGVLRQGERTYYVYDAGGQRARKVTESSAGIKKKERFYLGGFEIYREYDSGGAVILERETLHVMDDKQRVALVETRTQGSDGSPTQLIRYQFSNHLGSASLELDDSAKVISYEEYCPYGNTSYQAGQSAVEISFKRYRYTGVERDEETGFCYHGARYCAAWLGRWTSCDPAGILDGTNLYNYALNNPIAFRDPRGRQHEGGTIPTDWHELDQRVHQAAIDSGKKGSAKALERKHVPRGPDRETSIDALPKLVNKPPRLPALDDLPKGPYKREPEEPESITWPPLIKLPPLPKDKGEDRSWKIWKTTRPDVDPRSKPDAQLSLLLGKDPSGSRLMWTQFNLALAFPHLTLRGYHLNDKGSSEDYEDWKFLHYNILATQAVVQYQRLGIGPLYKSTKVSDEPVYRSQLSLGVASNLFDWQLSRRGKAFLDITAQGQYLHQFLNTRWLSDPNFGRGARTAEQISVGINFELHLSPRLSVSVQSPPFQYSTVQGRGLGTFFIGLILHEEDQWK